MAQLARPQPRTLHEPGKATWPSLVFALLSWTVHGSSAAPAARARRQHRALPWDAYQCPLRHASLVPEPDLSPEGDHPPGMDGRLCRSRRIIAKHGCLRHRGRCLDNRHPQQDRGAGRRADSGARSTPLVTQAGGVVNCGATGLGRLLGPGRDRSFQITRQRRQDVAQRDWCQPVRR